MHDGGIILIKAGQLITGRKQLTEATGIPETTIERILKGFESEHQIGQQKTNKYRVITILNWEEHQNRTPERTTNGQQTDTYKNDKKEKNTSAQSAQAYKVVPEEITNERTKSKPEYPHAPTVFKWFPNPEPAWRINTTECKHAELLFLRGEDKVKSALKFHEEHAVYEDRPMITKPSHLESKWNELIEFAKRNGL